MKYYIFLRKEQYIMIIEINNKDDKFYQYMGKFFGSRLVERQTNDRIYDDENKEWYLYLDKDIVVAFVSMQKGVLKNLYSYKEKYLEEILEYIKNKEKIRTSILTKKYIDVYKECGLQIINDNMYKNFVTVCDK